MRMLDISPWFGLLISTFDRIKREGWLGLKVVLEPLVLSHCGVESGTKAGYSS